MKVRTKGMLGIALLSILSIFFSANIFADDSSSTSEENKQLKAENAKLRKALEKKYDEEPISSTLKNEKEPKNSTLTNEKGPVNSTYKAENEVETQRNFWGGINLREWQESSNDPVITQNSSEPIQLLTFAAGYKNLFLTFTVVPTSASSPTSTGTIRRNEAAFGIGYYVTPNLAFVLGQKGVDGVYKDTVNSNNNAMYTASYNTLAVIYNWPISNTDWKIFGNAAYGKGDSSTTMTNVVNHVSNLAYSGYEIGATYSLSASSNLSVGYKSETASEAYYYSNGNTTVGILTRTGVFLGLGWAF